MYSTTSLTLETTLYLFEVGKPQLFNSSYNSLWFLSGASGQAPTPCTSICKGLLAVTVESFCLSEPLAEFLGFAKGALPSATKPSFSFAKSATPKKISPLISTTLGWSLPLSCCGICLMVFTLLVTSSPTTPSPRVAAETRLPFSYLKLIAKPSIFSSHRKLSASTRLAHAVSSSSSNALSKLHMRSRCSTGAKVSLALPPTL